MFSITFFLYLLQVLLALDNFSYVNAELYVSNPKLGNVCQGGEPCTVTWLDDGATPLLKDIGLCSVGLFTGKMQLVQRIEAVDISAHSSLVFTPLVDAGPNADTYYIAFTSLSSTLVSNGTQYLGYSPFFTLSGMTGSFANPVASATASIPIPTRIRTPNGSDSGNGVLSTVTVGTLSSLPPLTSLVATTPPSTPQITSTSSRFTTSPLPTSTSQSSITTSAATSKPTNAVSETFSRRGFRILILPIFAACILLA